MSLHAIFGQGANVRGGTCPSPGFLESLLICEEEQKLGQTYPHDLLLFSQVGQGHPVKIKCDNVLYAH